MFVKRWFLFLTVVGSMWPGFLSGHASGPDPGVNGILGGTPPAVSSTCAQAGCHSTSQLNTGGTLISVTGLPGEWTPGLTYPLTVTIQRTAARYGFQLSVVSDAANTQVGTLTTSGAGKVIRINGAIQYAQHTFPSTTSTFTVNWTAPSTATPGVVRFNAAGNAANGDGTNFGDFIYARVDKISPASATPPPPPLQTFYFPQIADGVQTDGVFWKTSIFLFNPSPGPATGAVTFAKSNGAAFSVPFVNGAGQVVSSGNTISFALESGETRKYVSSGVQPLDVGFATVTSSEIISGTAIFSEFAPNGALLGEAGVPAADAVARQSIFVDTVGGFKTGVAYANPGAVAASVTLQLLDAKGAAVLPPSVTTLGPGQHTAMYIGLPNQLFPSAPAFAGTMQIIGSTPLTAVALRFDPSFAHFTTLPPIILASSFREILSPLAWLQKFVSAVGDLYSRTFDAT